MKRLHVHRGKVFKKGSGDIHRVSIVGTMLLYSTLALIITIGFPVLLAISLHYQQSHPSKNLSEFPVTVDPRNKVIAENPRVNEFLDGVDSPLQASAGNKDDYLGRAFAWVATTIASAPILNSLAAVQGRFVSLTPGMRREQVASAFGDALGWSPAEKRAFLTAPPGSTLPLAEGSFSSGIYLVGKDASPTEAQALVNQRFTEEVLSRYSSSTAAIVPLEQALTVASLIERETGGPDDMRLISGIIWNRLFLNMRLQIDATLQYAKASTPATNSWWPRVVPDDRFRKSPYNTYMNTGLPPGPIATPSVAAVVAALNPKNTSCIFYFHDSHGDFHCSDTYAEHVKMLKQYYGRGK